MSNLPKKEELRSTRLKKIDDLEERRKDKEWVKVAIYIVISLITIYAIYWFVILETHVD